MMRVKSSLLALLLLALGAGQALAQCPDGTPPPCRGAASAASRRPNPPLDEQTWIIVPFDNVARVPDIDWLKDASVNLLYLDMSKWRDIRVIDDERVADFIREVPEARGGQALTLQSGIAVARRAGAGKLVMGDLLKVGARTQLVAKVFDVRTGQRLRTVRQDAPVADSIMPAFGLLARGVLNLEPPSGTSLGAIGTTRLDAYQEYMEGVRALNAFDIAVAHQHLEHAIALDSTFALAHYKLTIVIGWENSTDRAHLLHAQAAARLSAGLPARERTLISGQLAQANGDYGHACELYVPLLRADSNDVEALYNYGECSYHDVVVVPLPGDTTRFMFRGSWNASMRAFRRVLALDPTYHLAFQHVQDVLLAASRGGCVTQSDGSCQQGTWVAAVGRAGDSIVTVPVSGVRDILAYEAQLARARADHTRRRNLEEARAAALEWLQAGPAEWRARVVYGRILLRMGQVDSADAMLRTIGTGRRSRLEQAQVVGDRTEIALKLHHEDEAVRLVDSLHAALDSVPGARLQMAFGSPTFGRFHDIDSVMGQAVRGAPPAVAAYFPAQIRAFSGLPADSVLYAAERAFAELITTTQGASRSALLILPSLAWVDFRDRGSRWPFAPDTAGSDPRLRLVAFVAAGDASRLRRALAAYDSTVAAAADEPDYGYSLLSANAHLLLGDSLVALQRLRHFRDETWKGTPMNSQILTGFTFSGSLWARSFLLLGDLAAAQGQRAEAADAYRRFIGMWQHADPEAQPLVQRARDAVARLGN